MLSDEHCFGRFLIAGALPVIILDVENGGTGASWPAHQLPDSVAVPRQRDSQHFQDTDDEEIELQASRLHQNNG